MSHDKKTIKAVKLDDDDLVFIEKVKNMLSTDNTSEALRWCIRAARSHHGDEVESIVSERKAIKKIEF